MIRSIKRTMKDDLKETMERPNRFRDIGFAIATALALYALSAKGQEVKPNSTKRESQQVQYTQPINSLSRYSEFTKTNELADIFKHSARIGIEPEMLMALRMTENGSDRVAYGVLAHNNDKYQNDKGYTLEGKFNPYKNEVEKQMCWAGWTIRKRWNEFNSLGQDERAKFTDFVDFIGDSYCPIGAGNDPKGLNKNWEKNMRRFYQQLKE